MSNFKSHNSQRGKAAAEAEKKFNHKAPSAATPQPNLGISLAKALRRKGFKK
jgi:hypothetical protein